MIGWVIAAVAVLLCAERPVFAQPIFSPRQDPIAGSYVFGSKGCSKCHSINGAGGKVGPDLGRIPRPRSFYDLAAAMWNHGPAMAETMRAKGIARPTFSGSELVDLIAYLKSAAPDKTEGPLYILPGTPEEGRRLFVDKRCIECHSVAGQGGKVGPDLAARSLDRSLTQFAEAMWNKAPAMTAAMKVRKIAVPRLEAEEMSDIVAYLYSVQYFAAPGDPKKGREIATQKGCLACHSVDGTGNKGAPDLTRVKGLDSLQTVISAMWNHSFIGARRLEGQKVLWPQFRPEEMADLAAFLQTLGRGRT